MTKKLSLGCRQLRLDPIGHYTVDRSEHLSNTLRLQHIEEHYPPPFRLNQAGIPEYRQVLGYGRSVRSDHDSQLADAMRSIGERIEDEEPAGMSKCLQYPGTDLISLRGFGELLGH